MFDISLQDGTKKATILNNVGNYKGLGWIKKVSVKKIDSVYELRRKKA